MLMMILGSCLPMWLSGYGTKVPVSQYREDINTGLDWLKEQIQRDLVSHIPRLFVYYAKVQKGVEDALVVHV